MYADARHNPEVAHANINVQRQRPSLKYAAADIPRLRTPHSLTRHYSLRLSIPVNGQYM
jgi:hypothetical protein